MRLWHIERFGFQGFLCGFAFAQFAFLGFVVVVELPLRFSFGTRICFQVETQWLVLGLVEVKPVGFDMQVGWVGVFGNQVDCWFELDFEGLTSLTKRNLGGFSIQGCKC